MTRAAMRGARALSNQVPFTVVAAVMAAGFVFAAVVPEHWLRGVTIVAVGLALGAVLRALLPDSRAGLLAVRGRAFDILCWAALAVSVLTFAVLLPR